MAGVWVEGKKFVLCEALSKDTLREPVLCNRHSEEIGQCGEGESPHFGVCPVAETHLLAIAALRQRRGIFTLYLNQNATGIAVQEPDGGFYGLSGGREFGGTGKVSDSE